MDPQTFAISDLTLDPNNVRHHGPRSIEAIAKSLDAFGQQTPIVVAVVDGENVVVKGNGTVKAAESLGWSSVKGVVTELSEDLIRAYAIADNQTASLSSWDEERLLEQLGSLDEDLRSKVGFSEQELEVLLSKLDAVGGGGSDDAEPETVELVVKGITQANKDAMVSEVNQRLEEAGHAYTAVAY